MADDHKKKRTRIRENMKKHLLKTIQPFYSVAGNCRPSSGISLIRLPLNKEVVLYLRHKQRTLRMSWRISFQIIAMQLQDYKLAKSEEEHKLWKARITESLYRMNKQAQRFKNTSLPYDIPAPTAEYLALSATGNWCLRLTQELTCLFMSA